VFFLQYLLKLFIAEYHLTCTVQGFIYAWIWHSKIQQEWH
jgi:hypothetical protein